MTDHDLTGILEACEDLADGLRKLRGKLSEVRVTADSADGLVSATVGGRGELIDLTIDPRVYRDPDSRRLTDTILATVDCAVEQARKTVFGLAKPLLPRGAAIDDTDVDFDPALHQLDRTLRRV